MKKIILILILFSFEFVYATNANEVIDALKNDATFKTLTNNNANVKFENDEIRISFKGSEGNEYRFIFPCKNNVLEYSSKSITNYNDALNEAASAMFSSMIINKTLLLNGFNQTEINNFKTKSNITYEEIGLIFKEGINNPEDTSSINLMRSENYIKEKLKKYIILRMPIVLTPNNYYIKHMTLNRMVDFITVDDLNNSILSIIQNEKTYGKTYNISGFKTNSTTFIKNMYKYSGRISMFRRNLYYGEYSDDQIINKLTKITYSKPGDYYRVLKRENFIVLRYIRKFINLPKCIYYKIKTK